MSLQINKILTTSDNGTVASGSISKFKTLFLEDFFTVELYPSIYRSEQAFEDGKAPVTITDIPNKLTFNLGELTAEEIAILTQASTIIHEKYKALMAATTAINGAEYLAII